MNVNKPITKSEKFFRRRVVTSQEVCGNNYAHAILTAEADSLPTDEKKLLDDCGLVRCHSSRSNGPLVHVRIPVGSRVKKTMRTHMQQFLR